MYISFHELRQIKHSLPTGSVKRIADELEIEEQTVRNYFGAQKYQDGKIVGVHVQPGPDGGYVALEDDAIMKMARKILSDPVHESAPSAN